MDDFCVRFVGDQHANHLKSTLEKYYNTTVDWSGSKYIEITLTLDWDYQHRTLETSVPSYVKKTLHELQHPMSAKPQHAPATAAPIQYGAKQQPAIPEDTSPTLSTGGIKHIQKAVGMFAWYSTAGLPILRTHTNK